MCRLAEDKGNIVNTRIAVAVTFHFQQRPAHQAADAHRPAICVSEGHGGAQEDQAGAAVLALSAQQGRGGVREVDHRAGDSG